VLMGFSQPNIADTSSPSCWSCQFRNDNGVTSPFFAAANCLIVLP
jgi:hypothetical protein